MLFRSKAAAKKANPVLLEPYMKVEVDVPEQYMGDVIGSLNSRRGRIEGMETENGESKGLLQGKAMQQFITIGSSVAKYQEYGVDKSLNHCLINGLFNYCGIENVDYTLFGDIHIIDNAARQAMLDEAAEKTTAKLTALLTYFKQLEQPIIGRVEKGKIWLDLRSVADFKALLDTVEKL